MDENIKAIDLSNASLRVLSERTKNKLSLMLDNEKILRSPSGLLRDYRGLAEKFGFNFEETRSLPTTSKLLAKCIREKNITLRDLQSYLEEMDRYDVLDDTKEMIENDVRAYENRTNSLARNPITSNFSDSNSEMITPEITCDDFSRSQKGERLQTYDAIILYVETDEKFALDLRDELENRGFKICDKERDLMPGHEFEHTAIQTLIMERCYAILVILSEEFVRSTYHSSFVRFAEALNISDRGRRRIIPCIKKYFKPPAFYDFYVKLDYDRDMKYGYFWKKLETGLLAVKSAESVPTKSKESEGVRIEDITLVDKSSEINENSIKNTKIATTGSSSISQQELVETSNSSKQSLVEEKENLPSTSRRSFLNMTNFPSSSTQNSIKTLTKQFKRITKIKSTSKKKRIAQLDQ